MRGAFTEHTDRRDARVVQSGYLWSPSFWHSQMQHAGCAFAGLSWLGTGTLTETLLYFSVM